MIDIFNVNYVDILPSSLKNDVDVVAFAEAFNIETNKICNEIEKAIIYFNIDTLEVEVLDALAKNLKVDWYDKGYSIDVKRNIIKDSVKVHKYMGTLYAVKTAINNVLPGTTIKEWQEYGGEPYKFKINLEAGENGFNSEDIKKLLRQVDFYKNKRSHLEEASANITSDGNLYNATMSATGVTVTVEPYVAGEYTANVGGGIVAGITLTTTIIIEGAG